MTKHVAALMAFLRLWLNKTHPEMSVVLHVSHKLSMCGHALKSEL